MRNPFRKKTFKELAIELEAAKACRRRNQDEQFNKYILDIPTEVLPFSGFEPYMSHDNSFLPFKYLTKEQAQIYFEYFTNNIENFINNLKQIYQMYGYDDKDLDLSEESLVKLQTFIDENIEIIDIPEKELEMERNILRLKFKTQKAPSNIAEESLASFQQYTLDNIKTKEISLKWCTILFYVSVYFAHMLSINNNIEWEIYKKKNYHDFNMPVLQIGKVPGSFIGYSRNNVYQRLINGKKSDASLSKTYAYWCSFIDNK